MENVANYFYSEMLANMISQARYTVKSLKKQNYLYSPSSAAWEYQTIHFGGMRGSGHNTAIEALSHVFKCEIVCAIPAHIKLFADAKKGTSITWLDHVLQPGTHRHKFEVVFLDNWATMMLQAYPDVESMIHQLEPIYRGYTNSTIFVLIH